MVGDQAQEVCTALVGTKAQEACTDLAGNQAHEACPDLVGTEVQEACTALAGTQAQAVSSALAHRLVDVGRCHGLVVGMMAAMACVLGPPYAWLGMVLAWQGTLCMALAWLLELASALASPEPRHARYTGRFDKINYR